MRVHRQLLWGKRGAVNPCFTVIPHLLKCCDDTTVASPLDRRVLSRGTGFPVRELKPSSLKALEDWQLFWSPLCMDFTTEVLVAMTHYCKRKKERNGGRQISQVLLLKQVKEVSSIPRRNKKVCFSFLISTLFLCAQCQHKQFCWCTVT